MKKRIRILMLILLTLFPLSSISLRAQIALANVDTSGTSCESGGKQL